MSDKIDHAELGRTELLETHAKLARMAALNVATFDEKEKLKLVRLALDLTDLVEARDALLDDIREHLWSCGPPATGWGTIDRGRDSDQQDLLKRINDALEPQPQAEVSK